MEKLLILTFILLMACPVKGNAVMVAPSLGGGAEYNDNIDQTTVASADYISVFAGGAAYKSLDGDLYWEAAANLSRHAFSRSSYGYIDQQEAYLSLNYDLSERAAAGAGLAYSLHNDSALSTNNYHSLSLVPNLSYKLSIDTLINLSIGRTQLDFTASSETVSRQRQGIAIFHNWGNATFSLGGFYLTSDSNLALNNCNSNSFQAAAGYSLLEYTLLKIDYAYETLNYPNWSVPRQDTKSMAIAELKHKWNEAVDLYLNYTYINNRSTDPNYVFNNGIMAGGLTWKPSFGHLYGEGIETETGYYFEKGLQATDQGDWRQAEKYFRKVVFLADFSEDAHFQLGLALSKQAKFALSRAEFEKAIAINPDLTPAYYLLAYDLIKLGDKTAAAAVLEKLYQMTNDEKVKKILDSISAPPL